MPIFSFGKKQEEVPTNRTSVADLIMAMRQQGMDNSQIISELEKQGYNSSQIFDAINRVNIGGGNAGYEQPPDFGGYPQQDFSQMPPESYPQPQQYSQPSQPQGGRMDEDRIEEIAEVIIDEKWKEFEQHIKAIIEWKEKTESRINQIEQQMVDMTNSLNNLHKSLLNKISEYDKNIIDVGVEMKAMEKVFQKVLPSLTENVNKLERLTKSPRTAKNK